MAEQTSTQWREWFATATGRSFLSELIRRDEDLKRGWMSIAGQDDLKMAQGRAQGIRETINFIQSKTEWQPHELCAAAGKKLPDGP